MNQPQVTLYNTQKDFPLSLRELKQAILSLLSYLKINTDEVIIHFVTEKKISSLHKLLFNDPSVTDCISIPIDAPQDTGSGYHLLGEIFICVKTAHVYAAVHGIDPTQELFRYVVHGLLHLIGYDDIKLKDRRIMKKKEEECLRYLSPLLSRPI